MYIQHNTISIDIAKKVCQVHYILTSGKTVNRQIKTVKLTEYLVQFPSSIIAMEACGMSHGLARKLTEMGHDVKLLPPQFVKPFLIGNKNDKNDAKAIWKASFQPDINPVPVKSVEQQEVNFVHNLRVKAAEGRTKTINQIRAFYREFGIKAETSKQKLYLQISLTLEDAELKISFLGRELLSELKLRWQQSNEQIKRLEKLLKQYSEENDEIQRLMEIPGVGLISATSIVSCCGNLKQFKRGRDFAAWLGLVPRHFGSGGKNKITSLSKKGNEYLRSLLIHGARSVLALAIRGIGNSKWAELEKRTCFNKTCVAIANRNARVIWALLVKTERYKTI